MPRIVAMLPVRNEAGRRLPLVLDQLSRLTDTIVVYDDASTDETPDVCRSYAKVAYFRGDAPWFERDESQLRRHLWHLAVAHEPDWLLALDADELFEDQVYDQWHALMAQDDYDVIAFRLFDFWKSTTHVRVDGSWNPWYRFTPLLVRYQAALPDACAPRPVHCGRFPLAYQWVPAFQSSLRVRHYGWARAEDHLRKYLFYRDRDLAFSGRVADHTESILAPNIRVEDWLDLPTPPFFRRANPPGRT